MPKVVLPPEAETTSRKGISSTDVWKRVLLVVFGGWRQQQYSVLLVEAGGNTCCMLDRDLSYEEACQLVTAKHVNEAPGNILRGPVKTKQRWHMIKEHIIQTKRPVVALHQKKVAIYIVPEYDMVSSTSCDQPPSNQAASAGLQQGLSGPCIILPDIGPDIGPDMMGADMMGADMMGADMMGANAGLDHSYLEGLASGATDDINYRWPGDGYTIQGENGQLRQHLEESFLADDEGDYVPPSNQVMRLKWK